MSRTFLTLSLLAFAGCHATTTRAQDESSSRPAAEPPAAKAPRAKPRAAETLTTSRTTNAMFKPDGLKLLQRALTRPDAEVPETGLLDAATQTALLAFQTEKHLPRTGLPDFETLRLLGVKPDALYRHEPPAERLGMP
jgi:hypothetical protein